MTISLRDGEGPGPPSVGNGTGEIYLISSSQLSFKKSEIVSYGPFIKTISGIGNDPQVHALDWNLQNFVVIK